MRQGGGHLALELPVEVDRPRRLPKLGYRRGMRRIVKEQERIRVAD